MIRFFIAALFLLPCSTWAYDVQEVEHGGSVQGTVTLSGEVPDPKAYNLVIFPDPEYCGRISNGNGWRLLRDFFVNEERQIQHVVVLLEEDATRSPKCP